MIHMQHRSGSRQEFLSVVPLLFSMILSAIGGIVYELIVAGISSYLLGNSIYQFSLVIGLYLFAMGFGAFVSKYIKGRLVDVFLVVEILIGLIGGSSALVLFATYAFSNLYQPVMFVLIIIIGTLVGLEIPLLTRIIEGWHRNLKATLANVLSFDYIGSLIGSIAFPLLLFPYLGFIRTAFLIGLVNLVVVAIILFRFRAGIYRRQWITLVALVTIALLVSGFVRARPLSYYLEQRLYDDEIVYLKVTSYQKIVLTRYRNDFRLYLNGNLQFSSIDEYRYHEALVHPALSLARNREYVLVLGGGDGLAVREILKYPDVKQVTVVDLDPAITKLATTHPVFLELNERSLLSPRVKVVNADAHKFLEESSDLYQVIIIDLPDPNTEALNKLYTAQFYKLVRRHLAADGFMVTQSTSPYFAPLAFWSIGKTVEAAGFRVQSYHVNVPSFGDWGFTVGATHPFNLQKLKLTVPTRYLNKEIIESMTSFGADVALYREQVEVNTISHPVLLGYYERSYKNW